MDRKGISSTNTCFSVAHPESTNPDCYEGNLDLQFLMGVSQATTTIYWYDGSGNPFIGWITSVSNTAKPPLSNSISWGSVEQVSITTVYYLLSAPLHSTSLLPLHRIIENICHTLYSLMFHMHKCTSLTASGHRHYELFQQRSHQARTHGRNNRSVFRCVRM